MSKNKSLAYSAKTAPMSWSPPQKTPLGIDSGDSYPSTAFSQQIESDSFQLNDHYQKITLSLS